MCKQRFLYNTPRLILNEKGEIGCPRKASTSFPTRESGVSGGQGRHALLAPMILRRKPLRKPGIEPAIKEPNFISTVATGGSGNAILTVATRFLRRVEYCQKFLSKNVFSSIVRLTKTTHLFCRRFFFVSSIWAFPQGFLRSEMTLLKTGWKKFPTLSRCQNIRSTT